MSRGRRRLPGDRRPSSHRTTPPQGAHRQRLQLFPDMGLRFPKCYSPSEGTAGEPLGRSPGQGAGSCRAAPEVAGAAVQSSTRQQGQAAASLSRPRAPRSITGRAGGEGACGAQPSEPLHAGPRPEPAAVPAPLLPRCAVSGKSFSSLGLSVLVCKSEMRQHLP